VVSRVTFWGSFSGCQARASTWKRADFRTPTLPEEEFDGIFSRNDHRLAKSGAKTLAEDENQPERSTDVCIPCVEKITARSLVHRALLDWLTNRGRELRLLSAKHVLQVGNSENSRLLRGSSVFSRHLAYVKLRKIANLSSDDALKV
jgi:hypothetical protein